jgi:hypothetical protein
MQQPIEIDVDEHEQLVQRVAGIDVAKASGMVCTRVPHDSVPGRRVTKVWEVPADTQSLSELADHLICQGVERVVLESTSDYWRGFFYILAARGLSVWLVNATQVKNVPGRPKSDKLDAVWLAKLAEKSMVSPSFVPAEPMRHVRTGQRPGPDPPLCTGTGAARPVHRPPRRPGPDAAGSDRRTQRTHHRDHRPAR